MSSASVGDDVDHVSAPPRPPPFLSPAEIDQLCSQGYLDLDLSPLIMGQVEKLFEETSSFFMLPAETKARLFPSPAESSETGYSCIPDEKEFITLRFVSPPQGNSSEKEEAVRAGIETLVARTWHDLAHLMHRILVDISVHLGHIMPSAWDPVIENTLGLPVSSEKATPALMRIFRYEPEKGVADPHKDLGLLTICICDDKGLQVFDRSLAPAPGVSRDGNPDEDSLPDAEAESPSNHGSRNTRWRDAGRVTILTGDTLRILSGNKINSGFHRVVATEKGRRSVVFAWRASTDTLIDLADFGGTGVIASKALWDRIKGSRVNINAQKHIRQEQTERRRMKNAVQDIA